MYNQEDLEVENTGTYSTKDDLTKSFSVVLKDLPEVLHYIKRLNEHIRRQQTTILKLFEKLKEFKTKTFNIAEVGTQTDEDVYYNYWNAGQVYDAAQVSAWNAAAGITPMTTAETASTDVAKAFADEIKLAAESAVQQTGFVYEASSGLYYDYNTGYYYNAELGLYYDGASGTYFYYNEGTNQFEYHSQAQFPEEEAVESEDGQTTVAVPTLPASFSNITSITSLKPPPPPLPPKSPPPPARVPDRKRSPKQEESSGRKRRREVSPVEGRESPEDGEITDSGSSNDAPESVEKPKPASLKEEKKEEEKEEELSEKEWDSPPPTPPGETSSRYPNNPVEELVNAWPPCIRAIVHKTALTNLKVGALFIVTCDGGTLGREEGHTVCIPDINISKHHARFTFDSEDGKYYITDMGSRNGTLLDGHRLSSAKQESEPHEIKHDTKLQLGSTTLVCHVHGGNETCGDCEPGVVGAINSTNDNGTDSAPVPVVPKGAQHKQELRRLRQKFGLTSAEGAAGATCSGAGYEDRAQNRRQTVGSSDHNAKTETASVDEHIKSSNKGFKMLAKMGWSHGQGLGKDGSGGTTEPILVGQRPDKAGLGVDVDSLPPEVDDRTKRKADVWRKVQQRYSELPAEKPPTDDEDE